MEEIPLGSLLFRGVAVIGLVAANAFFVAAEFALVATRSTRIETMVRQGDPKAKHVQKAIRSLDRYISGTQLGITVASLGLGWIGEPAVASVLDRFFSFLPDPFAAFATHSVAVGIAFFFITFLHIVLGELAPKAIALLHPEATSRWLAGPLMGFTVATNPFIWLLNGTANALLKLVGARAPTKAERVHQPEEIVMLAKQSQESGQLATQEVRFIEGVFEFATKTARDVMTPRTQVAALSAELSLEDAVEHVAEAGRSRYPVYGDSLDDVIGVVHAKEILANLSRDRGKSVKSIMREPIFVPGARRVDQTLSDMKRLKNHMAIVLDEYGGTAGLVTMEDLLEEIVGEIYDEYDRPEPSPVASPDAVTLPGSTPLAEANKRYNLDISDVNFQTVGGYVFGALGRLPAPGDRVEVKEGVLEVAEMDGRRVGTLKLIRTGTDTAKQRGRREAEKPT